MEDSFKVIVPAEISKAKDGSYRIRGIASTEDFDAQGEMLLQNGLDLTPIDERRGILNWDHGKDPTDIVGILDGYKQTKKGLQIEGTLFKNHTKANAIREIMESLGEKDKGRMGLSVQGCIIQRNKDNPNIVEKCRIDAVALTMSPVNAATHVALVKSLSTATVEFNMVGKKQSVDPTYTAAQVIDLLTKALGVGSGGMEAPNTRTDGDAMAMENLGTKLKKKKKKKLSKAEEIEADLHGVLEKLQVLYPLVLVEDLWHALKTRLNTHFPDME